MPVACYRGAAVLPANYGKPRRLGVRAGWLGCRRPARLASLAAVAIGVGLLLPGLAGALPSAGTLRRSLAGQRALQQRLAAGSAGLTRLIGQLSGQVAVVQRRESEVRAQLAAAGAQLAAVRASLAIARHQARVFAGRLSHARAALAQELVSGYESDPPDVVSLVLESHSFGDLLQRLDFLRLVKSREQLVIGHARLAKRAADAAGRRYGALVASDTRITTGIASQVRAVAAMDSLLSGRAEALRTARAAQLAELHDSRAHSVALRRQLDRVLAAQQAPAAAAVPSGGWAIPYPVVMCESGGQNLPPNSAGASGYYQILASTWQGEGGHGPAAYLAPKAEQDRIAAKLWDGGRGASNWVCAGIVGIH